jgi:hypothetical protein
MTEFPCLHGDSCYISELGDIARYDCAVDDRSWYVWMIHSIILSNLLVHRQEIDCGHHDRDLSHKGSIHSSNEGINVTTTDTYFGNYNCNIQYSGLRCATIQLLPLECERSTFLNFPKGTPVVEQSDDAHWFFL